jgi:DNA-binding response OmpR family regulator
MRQTTGAGAEVGAGGARPRIFLVEDDAATARSFVMVLGLYGYEVRHAGTCREAIERADGEFDLVLSDIALPDGSGWDVMRHIRARWAGVPGIALSGFGGEEDAEASRAAGFAIHLTKPVPFPELKAVIDALIARP